MIQKSGKHKLAVIFLFLAVFIWSAIRPQYFTVWLLEISGVILLTSVYLFYDRKIQFSLITHTMFFIGMCLISIGAHYSFPEVPIMDGFRGVFKSERNNYDKIGHLFQGILPVLISWEIFVKKRVVQDRLWINFLSFCIAISVSGVYELIEWLFIILFGDNGFTYNVLGTQGYVWDAQSDMLSALIGAMLVILFGQRHLVFLIKRMSIEQPIP